MTFATRATSATGKQLKTIGAFSAVDNNVCFPGLEIISMLTAMAKAQIKGGSRFVGT